MAHLCRIEYEGALYHVFYRGNNQQEIIVTIGEKLSGIQMNTGAFG